MNVETINKILGSRSGGKKQLAAELGVSYDSLRLILSGKRPLTEQLSRHISYVLGQPKTQAFVYAVNLPEGTAQRWVPGFGALTPEEQQCALEAVAKSVLEELEERGRAALSEADAEQLERLQNDTAAENPEPN